MPDGSPTYLPAAAADFCVCVPARDEEERLSVLLAALAQQSWPGVIRVVVALNNTTDASRSVVTDARAAFQGRLHVHVEDVTFPPELAHAGSARRLAMNTGLSLLAGSEQGILVSTDADACPPPPWLENIAAAFDRGADLVGGRIEIDQAEALPPDVARLRNAWDRYWNAVRTIEDELDPVPWNPPPRHGDHTGASLAIRAQLYRRCGGVPLVPTGEDRALVAAAIACGGRLAHPANVRTFVSPRRNGRAEGGMACAMNELYDLAAQCDAPTAPSYEQWRERALWRRRLRAQANGHARIPQEEMLLAPMRRDMKLEIGP